jgi:glycosyltransferase involved in cell wall biosynthesis
MLAAVTSRPFAGLVDVVVVARDSAETLASLLANLPRRAIRSVVVVDNRSHDTTAHLARDAGAVVLREPAEGHGAACRRAVAHLASLPVPPDVVVFLAPDGSDDPAELGRLLQPIRDDNAELVIGIRPGTQPPEARLALGLIGLVYRHRFRDLGGYRAIRFPALVALGLRDRGAGWNVEMQVRAIALGLKVAEIELAGGGLPARGGTRARLGAAGRMLFHIVRHATAR